MEWMVAGVIALLLAAAVLGWFLGDAIAKGGK